MMKTNLSIPWLIVPDEMLFSFMVPLLPFILENRIGGKAADTQRLTSAFLVEGALISIISGPPIGDIADRVKSKKVLLLVLLGLTLISIVCLSVTTSCKS
jgi:MFS family permease